jgi:hypothetical protein
MDDGKWALESEKGRKDSGTYRIVSRHVMYLWGTNGASTWTDRPRKFSDDSVPPPTADTPQDAEGLDTKLVGTWFGYVRKNGGRYNSELTISRNGRYTWTFTGGTETTTQAGRFEAAQGRWAIRPDNGKFDHGTYSVVWDEAGKKPVLTMSTTQSGSPLESIQWVNKVR